MLTTTVPRLKCPHCDSSVKALPQEVLPIGTTGRQVGEVRTGNLECENCQAQFPILAGVAVVVEDVESYLLYHVKGISKLVQDSEIPEQYREGFLDAKNEIEAEHIEEDLEAERVNALYVMTHYLKTDDSASASGAWWKPRSGTGSPLIDALVRQHWDHGPFSQIQQWVSELAKTGNAGAVVELGCGVGGLYPTVKGRIKSYLGVDSSFASIAIARHLGLGVPYSGSIGIPEDLLEGPVSRKLQFSRATTCDGSADFIVGEVQSPPLMPEQCDVCIALNMIDMLDDPSLLPELQREFLKSSGIAIQSGPYIWHEQVASALRAKLPKDLKDSAAAVQWLYENAGFTIQKTVDHVPWLFFKHARQLEIYSVHMLLARKSA